MAAPRSELLFAAVGRRPIRTLSLLFAVCVATFLITIPLPRIDHLLIGSDGVRYYCYVHSLVIDGDLDFRDEYIRLYSPRDVPADTPAGRPPNKMSIGMGLVWMPFFVAAHVLSALLGLPTDGYSYVYQAAVCLGSMTYGFIGLLLTYRLCRERVDAASAAVAVALIWFTSNVLYYMVVEPSMSHMASLGAVSALLAWWRLGHDRSSFRYWTGLGALGGLAALIRPQDGLFLLLPAVQWAIEARHRARHGRLLAAHAARGAAMAVTAALLFAIQLWAWWVVYGSLRGSGYFYSGHEGFNWWHPHVIDVLFSSFHGFFTWHPIYLVGAVGLWWVVKAERTYGTLLVLCVAVQVYLVAAWGAWWQGAAFGGRVLISTVPIFALGLAEVVARLRRVSSWAVILPSIGLLLWNFAFMLQYRVGLIPMGHRIDARQLVWEKFTLPIDLWHRLGH